MASGHGASAKIVAVMNFTALGSDLFVGRRDELATLEQCAAHVAGRRPRVVYIEGEAGTGKSALVRHLRRRLADDWATLRAPAPELARHEPMWLLRQLVLSAGDRHLPASPHDDGQLTHPVGPSNIPRSRVDRYGARDLSPPLLRCLGRGRSPPRRLRWIWTLGRPQVAAIGRIALAISSARGTYSTASNGTEERPV